MNGKDLLKRWENRKKTGVYIAFFMFLIVMATTTLSTTPSGMTVYVAGDGRGNFNCDGADDQIEINKALAYVAEHPEFTTVHLKGPNTYVISDSILVGSDTILEGDPTAVVKLEDKADWPATKPLVTQIDSGGESNITIKGFEMDGNHDGNTDKKKGAGYYNLIHFINSTNIQVHNLYMHDSHGDGLKVENSSNIQFYDNKVYKLGHDGFYGIQSQYMEAWNNTITCRTNSGLRIWNSNHVKFHDNTIDSFYHWSAGGPGIQVQKSSGTMDDIEVYNNTIHNTYGPGIWLLSYGNYPTEEAQNVHIHHNTLYSTGTNPSIDWVGGIVTSGFNNTLIENNVFDGTYHTAIALMYPTGYSTDLSPKGTGYTTIVRNNIITNTERRKSESGGTGYGVVNYLPETHSFLLESNCFYKNVAGDYRNATSTSDIYVNPLFTNQKGNDYHLRSAGGRWNGKVWVKDIGSSPCIDAGKPFSDYSNEPEDNGQRINIGRYGNTEEASKSGVMPGYVAWWNKIFSPDWRIFRILLRAFFLLCFKIQI
ncbi:MAG: right-handed parallel beta-helix repeat-containing protein [Methanosarcina sp.]